MNWTRMIPLLVLAAAIGWSIAALLNAYVPTLIAIDSPSGVAYSDALPDQEFDDTNRSIFNRLAEDSDSYANDYNGGWRRTAGGLEHMSTWPRTYSFRHPTLHPLVVVAAQILIILFVVLAASPERISNSNLEMPLSFRLLKLSDTTKSPISTGNPSGDASSGTVQLNPIRFAGRRPASNRQIVDS